MKQLVEELKERSLSEACAIFANNYDANGYQANRGTCNSGPVEGYQFSEMGISLFVQFYLMMAKF